MYKESCLRKVSGMSVSAKLSIFFELHACLNYWESGSHGPPESESRESTSDTDCPAERVYCFFCRRPEEGPMLACDNLSCPYEWFHFSCLRLKTAPVGKSWFAPAAEQSAKAKRRRHNHMQCCLNSYQCIH